MEASLLLNTDARILVPVSRNGCLLRFSARCGLIVVEVNAVRCVHLITLELD